MATAKVRLRRPDDCADPASTAPQHGDLILGPGYWTDGAHACVRRISRCPEEVTPHVLSRAPATSETRPARILCVGAGLTLGHSGGGPLVQAAR
jgi:hypothetical protein